MSSRNQHVTKRKDGTWQVKGEGNSRATKVTKTQAEAISRAMDIAKNQHSEMFIHNRDGKIRDRSSYGHDPYPPRG